MFETMGKFDGSTGRRRGTGAWLGASVAVASLMVSLGAGLVRAQEDAESHPAHIHAGTCEDLGDVVFPLPNLTATGVIDGMLTMATEDPPAADSAAAEGPASAVPAKASWSFVDADLATLIEGGHAINVHESDENIEEYIACGDIGGSVTTVPEGEAGDGVLIIGLRELNGSGHTGIAVLQGMEDRTWVQVYVSPVLGEAGAATSGDSTPVAAAEDAAAVTIQGFKYDPAEITIPVGGSVTWTNEDAAPHTATGDGLQSGTMNLGDEFTQTFDEAGTFDYHCEFHAQMNGTVVVE